MKKQSLALACLVLTGALASGCGSTSAIRDVVEAGNTAASNEGKAYQQLKAAAPSRGEGSIAALQGWVSALGDVKIAMSKANAKIAKLKSEDDQKVRSAVSAELGRLKQSIDEMLGRNYEEAMLKLVPPWRLTEAKNLAVQAEGDLKDINASYDVVFATKSTFSGKNYLVATNQDAEILDTYGPCVDKVMAVAKGQASSSYCENAAKAACGHQIDLSCLQNKVQAKLVKETCPDTKLETIKLPVGVTFRPESYIDSRTEEVKEWKEGNVVSEPNPDRYYQTFCLGRYDVDKNIYTSSTNCTSKEPQVRVYGYDSDRHVYIEVLNVKHPDDASKAQILNYYSKGPLLGSKGDVRGELYTFIINETAFQPNTPLRLQFLDYMKATITNEQGKTRESTAHWVVDTTITGADNATIDKKEYLLSKYTPNKWVAGGSD